MDDLRIIELYFNRDEQAIPQIVKGKINASHP